MNIIKPTIILDTLFQSSNIPETDYTEWSAATTYDEGDKCMITTPNIHRIYEALQGMTGDFLSLDQTTRIWRGMVAAPNGNIYACVAASGDIYMQTAGAGDFVALSQTGREWYGMAATPNGNIYACVNLGDIYMRTAGAGNFVALSQTSRDWRGMAAAPNGNVYACVNGGDIYMQTAGAGDFVALSQTVRNWRGIAAAPNGNVYACVFAGDIYMQTAGAGDFVALSQTVREWYDIAAAPNGNIYANVSGGDIYMQTSGVGAFVALSQTTRTWRGMAAAPNGNIYACVNLDDIYMRKIINLNENPPDNLTGVTPFWLEIGATNRWEVFDTKVQSQASQATSLNWVLNPGLIDGIALLNLDATSVQIVMANQATDLVTNGTAWTGATGVTPPTSWDLVYSPSNFTIDGGALKITVDAANEGISQMITVVAGTEMQLLGVYRNTAGDIAQYAVYDMTHSTNILAITDLASSVVNSTLSYVFTVPAGCTLVRISLMAKANGDIVWFDTVSLSEVVYNETTASPGTDLVATDLSSIITNSITIIVTHTAGTALCGEIVVGLKFGIGTLQYSPSIGIIDYSIKAVDAFGNYSITERAYSKRMSFDLLINNTIVDAVFQQLATYRATPIVWVGSESYSSLIIYGFYKSFEIVIPYPNYSECNLEIEGLT